MKKITAKHARTAAAKLDKATKETEQAPAITEQPEPARYDLTEATIRAKYAWIEQWEADPKRRIYKSTLHNARVDMQRELDSLKAIDVSAEFRALVNA